MTEEWRVVSNTNEKYEVNRRGDIRRRIKGIKLKAGDLIKPTPNSDGYLAIQAPVMGAGHRKDLKIHRIVAEAFLGERPGGMEINHKDGDKLNNTAENLEYVTHAENMRHAARHNLLPSVRGVKNPNAKLTEDQVREVRKQHEITGMGSKTLSKHMGLPHGAVYNILYNGSWSWLS